VLRVRACRRRSPVTRPQHRRDARAARAVETSTRLNVNATSLGGTETSIESRHRWEGDRVPQNLLRLSVGLEDAEELWADLERALG
jgi:cystathionine gamma-synthase